MVKYLALEESKKDLDWLMEQGSQSLDLRGVAERMELLLPSADVAPVVHGRWLNTEHLDGHMYGECSECHKIRIIDEYCSHCGARMDGGMK